MPSNTSTNYYSAIGTEVQANSEKNSAPAAETINELLSDLAIDNGELDSGFTEEDAIAQLDALDLTAIESSGSETPPQTIDVAEQPRTVRPNIDSDEPFDCNDPLNRALNFAYYGRTDVTAPTQCEPAAAVEIDELPLDGDGEGLGAVDRAAPTQGVATAEILSLDSPVVVAQRKPFKAASGHKLGSDDPTAELGKNTDIRRAILLKQAETKPLYAKHVYLADWWEADALNQLRGATTPEQRAEALGIDCNKLAVFDQLVAALERGPWKQCADFWRGIRPLLQQPTVLRGRITDKGHIVPINDLCAASGISTRTFRRRLAKNKNGTLAELTAPPRSGHSPNFIIHNGERFTPDQFARRFEIPRAQAREGAAKGLTGEEILAVPRKPRGRPRGSARKPAD